MSKYDPLREALARNGSSEIRMSFDQISRLVGGLPASAFSHASWWSNETSSETRHVQGRAWADAGYAVTIDRSAEVATFKIQ